jgi:hypothetical protein
MTLHIKFSLVLLFCLFSLSFCLCQNTSKQNKKIEVKKESNYVSEEPHNTYNTAIGLRGGYPSGLTIKHFRNERTAVEGLIMFLPGFINLTGLWELHKQAFDTERLHWFYGVGAHISSYSRNYPKRWNGDYYTDHYVSFGIDGILGLEYHMKEIPFTIGVDIKPAIDIINPSLNLWGGALSLRYAF